MTAKTEKPTGLDLLREFERWLPVVGYEGLYSVSDRGRVRSEARHRAGKAGKPVSVRERILLATPTRDGHLRVRLCDGATKISTAVHHLVLSAFVGPRPLGMQACHNDGAPSHNAINNLRWDTPKSNQMDRKRHGTSSAGEKNGAAKLTAAEVSAIRSDGRKYYVIANDHGVSRSTIGLVKAGKTWSHLGEMV